MTTLRPLVLDALRNITEAQRQKAADLAVDVEKLAHQVTPEWSLDKILLVYDLVRAGNSASRIESMTGIKRLAVLGKVTRLNAKGFNIVLGMNRTPAMKSATSAASRQKREAKAGNAVKPPRTYKDIYEQRRAQVAGYGGPDENAEPLPPSTEEVDVPPGKRKPFAKLDMGDCKWPIGDPRSADFGFCGHKAVMGKPYCEDHCQRAYVTIEVARRRSEAAIKRKETIKNGGRAKSRETA